MIRFASMARTADQLRREKRAEETAADYIGVAKAAALAREGYFRAQIDREDAAKVTVERPVETRYEVCSLNGAVVAYGSSSAEAKAKIDDADPGMAVILYRVRNGKRFPMAERISVNGSTGRRRWREL